jgi:predicted transcriptional regulator
MRRIEKRGDRVLKTVQLDPEVAAELRNFAHTSGKPIRWHVERAIAAALDISAPVYRLPRLERIARGIVSAADPAVETMPMLVEALNVRCDKLGIPRPHVQTARKHLRDAAQTVASKAGRLEARTARSFSNEEDDLLLRERSRGKSLSQIGMIVERRPNVILRRLRYLEGTQSGGEGT